MTDIERLQNLLYQQFLKEFEAVIENNKNSMLLRKVYEPIETRIAQEGFRLKWNQLLDETTISL